MIVPTLLLALAFILVILAALIFKDVFDETTSPPPFAAVFAIGFTICAAAIIIGLIEHYSANTLSILYSIAKGAI